MTITPEKLAESGSEHAHQSALFCWAALPETQAKYPDLKWMFAIPNGGERNMKVASQLKAEGVKAGVLDIFLPVPIYTNTANHEAWHGLFIEMKVKNNKPSKEQNEFAMAVRTRGYAVYLCYSWEEARDCIIRYLDHKPNHIG